MRAKKLTDDEREKLMTEILLQEYENEASDEEGLSFNTWTFGNEMIDELNELSDEDLKAKHREMVGLEAESALTTAGKSERALVKNPKFTWEKVGSSGHGKSQWQYIEVYMNGKYVGLISYCKSQNEIGVVPHDKSKGPALDIYKQEFDQLVKQMNEQLGTSFKA